MLLKCGKIVGTHGIKGEFKVYLNTDFKDDRFVKGKDITLENGVVLHITHVRYHKGNALLTVKDHPSINDVEPYIGQTVFTESTLETETEGFFYFELIGCHVEDAVYGDIGVVDHILQTGAHDVLYVIKGKKKTLIPYINEFIVQEYIDEKRIEVRLIKGMYDED